MAQEFIINSPNIEDKINQLLPSQGGFGAGVDFSASTMVIPVVNITEAAEGSTLREDLQSCLSFTTANAFDVNNTTTTVINTTGYWRCVGGITLLIGNGGSQRTNFIINDGTSDKIVSALSTNGSTQKAIASELFDFTFKLEAGHVFKITCTGDVVCRGSIRQIADLSGNLINP
jgi:hypothetical protein